MKNHITTLLFNLLIINTLNSQILFNDIKNINNFNIRKKPFYFGVASFDPTDSTVIIWTKITPNSVKDSISVCWQISQSPDFKSNTDSGKTLCYPADDYSVIIKIKNLLPKTTYFYRFYALNNFSDTGRTKTLPSADDTTAVKFAFFTGSNYQAGYFNAYGIASRMNNISAFVHLGDYIYEYQNNRYPRHSIRLAAPDHECLTLKDYRLRLATYRLDPQLQKAHKLFPWFVIWDDHEIANNSWKYGAQNHQATEGKWFDRKKAAEKAFFEWIATNNNDTNIYRTVRSGKNLQIILLDTRNQQRSYQYINNFDTNKTMLGQTQLNWLFRTLTKAKKDSVKWILIAQQVMFSPLTIGRTVLNNDQWDGYYYERQKILKFITSNKLQNIIIASGDNHTSWFNLIKYKQTQIPEFITPSITSPSLKKIPAKISQPVVKLLFKSTKYVNLWRKGFMTINFTRSNVIVKWYYIKTIKSPHTLIINKKYKIVYPLPKD